MRSTRNTVPRRHSRASRPSRGDSARHSASCTQQVSAAHGTLIVSQQLLADHLRALYEAGDVDPLAIVLGSESLDDAMTRLDDLSHVADQTARSLLRTRAAQIRLLRLRTTLSAHRARVDATLGRARQAAGALAAAHAERLSYIGSLHRQQRFAASEIGALEVTAQRIAMKSQTIQDAADPPASPTSTTAPAPSEGGHTLTVSSTGYSLPGHTATGLPVGWGIVAVDPRVIPLGTKLTVPGYGEAVAADTGSASAARRSTSGSRRSRRRAPGGAASVTITLH